MHAFRQELIRILKGPTGGLLMSLALAALLGGVAMAAPATSFGHVDQQHASEDPTADAVVAPAASLAGSSRGTIVASGVLANGHASPHPGASSANGRDAHAATHGGQANAHGAAAEGHAPHSGSHEATPRAHVPDQGDASSGADDAGVPDDHAVTSNGSARSTDRAHAEGAGAAGHEVDRTNVG